MANIFRAAVCTALTGPDSIRIEAFDPGAPGAGQVRIAVKAVGVGFPDLLMTYGKYQFRPEPSFIPGSEMAGVVEAVGPDANGWAVGDRVMGGAKGGCLAERVLVEAANLRALPQALSFEEGACWGSGAITAWHALHDKAALQAGESVLILGASGGVGMSAVKLAKHKGAVVIGTGSTEAKRAIISAAGADHVLDPTDRDLAAKVKALTGGAGVDVVYDPVGGDLAITATRAIAWGGRYLIVGFASGEIPKFPANHAMIKGYSLIGLRAGESSRRDPVLGERNRQAMEVLAEQGVMRPHISHRVSLADAAEAFHLLERREVIGRAVVTL